MESNVKREYNIEAGWLRVVPVLDRKNPGDELMRSEVSEASGFGEWKCFARRIRKHYRTRQIEIDPITGTGWRLHTGDSQVKKYAQDKKRQARRSDAVALRAVITARPETSEAKALRDHDIRTIGARLAMHEADRSETKAIIGAPAPSPRPLLKPVKGDK